MNQELKGRRTAVHLVWQRDVLRRLLRYSLDQQIVNDYAALVENTEPHKAVWKRSVPDNSDLLIVHQ